MNSRELMSAAMERRPVDMIPIAPYFWGAEYSWKLMGKPIWEVLHGPLNNTIDLLTALDSRHECDWLVPLHSGSGWLKGKRVLHEDSSRVFFVDEATGDEWIFHKEGHWLAPHYPSPRPSPTGGEGEISQGRRGAGGEGRPISNAGQGVEPPRTKVEADAWLEPRLSPPNYSPVVGNTTLRERFPNRFLCGAMPAPFAGLAYNLGFETTLLLLSENPSLCAYMAEQLMGDVERRATKLVADDFDAGLMCDSWASADILSPQTYRDWIAPLHRRISDALHAVGLKSVIYNTGNVLPMLDTIANMGYDAISIEERIKGVEMDIVEVRKTVGPDICLFGNFDSYLLLAGDRKKIGMFQKIVYISIRDA